MIGDYSEVADAQLDGLEQADPVTYTAVLDACEFIFRAPGRAQSISTAISTPEGVVLRLPVIGHAPWKVFWTTGGPRVEAVFPHP